MLEDVLALPDHLRDALWRVESAGLQPAESAGLLVCGMGGSAIGGDLAAAALGDRLGAPLCTVRGYRLPSWATPEWTVLCASYSGNTEETLACFAAAESLGARRVAVSTGGELADAARAAGAPVVGLPGILQPRAAVGYMFVAVAALAALAGVGPSLRSEIEATASFLEGAGESLRARATEIAAALHGLTPVVYGAGLTAPAARRWKTQVNENAKLPAFFSELPEADHNELCGWGQGPVGEGGLAAVLLEDAPQHPRERRHFELTAEAIEAGGAKVVRVQSAGETPVERLFWSVMLGDLVSLELAAARGVDPMPVEPIESFKAARGRT